MKLKYIQNQPQKAAFAAIFVVLLPNIFPNLLTPLSGAYPSLFSEWNAPRPKHLHLLKKALLHEPSDQQQADLWSPLPNQGWKPCIDSTSVPSLPKKFQGYIQVFLDGGLNQQRMGICDAVAVAKIIGATLVIPYLEVNPVWKDSSSFADIFDIDHFINTLKDEVSIVKELPEKYSWSTREYYATGIRATRIKTAPIHAPADWYLENVVPILQRFEWNAPRPKHLHLLKKALLHEPSDQQQADLWSPLPNQGWKPCIDSTSVPSLPKKFQGYIQVFLDGGLNQQRMGICDAVAVIKIIGATLVIPYLEVNLVWKDSRMKFLQSKSFLRNTHGALESIMPQAYELLELKQHQFMRLQTGTLKMSVPILQSYGLAAISPFSHRLAFDNMPAEIQHLRCRVNFQALVFTPQITMLGEALINRLRGHPPGSSSVETKSFDKRRDLIDKGKNKKFVVLHLRFDKDMAAHSACKFGGGKAERLALAKYRQVIWQGRVLKSQFTDEELRSQGRCPLTPEEIGLLLAALGFNNSTRLYLASHKVYGGEARISTLRELFPLMEDKKSLTSPDERAVIEGKASLSAAVDYYVSMQSEIFISASPGNMHNALAAHRAYNNMKTIRPNMVLLGQLFLNTGMDWTEFQQAVQNGHKNRQGQLRIRKEKQSIYTYPAPDCMCQA